MVGIPGGVDAFVFAFQVVCPVGVKVMPCQPRRRRCRRPPWRRGAAGQSAHSSVRCRRPIRSQRDRRSYDGRAPAVRARRARVRRVRELPVEISPLIVWAYGEPERKASSSASSSASSHTSCVPFADAAIHAATEVRWVSLVIINLRRVGCGERVGGVGQAEVESKVCVGAPDPVLQ